MYFPASGMAMATNPDKTLRNLRNKRDFRAELLNVAADLANSESEVVIRVENPAISIETVRSEWDRLIQAIKPDIATRMRLELESIEAQSAPAGTRPLATSDTIRLDRPNYRAEVLRLLIGANFARDDMWSVKGLIKQIGASQTPVRDALGELKRAEVLHDWGGSHVDLVPEDLSMELLAKLHALPQTLRFRFERGAQIRSPAELLNRALPLLGSGTKGAWANIALSGTAVAQAEVTDLDLTGTPRLDLLAFVPRDAKVFDATILRKLNDGLEYEPNVLAPAPVVLTLVRADTMEIRTDVIEDVRCAPSMDIFLSLLEMNLRQQAVQYAQAIRR